MEANLKNSYSIIRNFLKEKYPLFIIILLLFFYGINNYIWLMLNKLPPTTDQTFHLLNNLKYLDILTNPSWDIFARLRRVHTFYPPFFTFCVAIVNLAFGHSVTTSIMTNMFFAAILFFSIYYIGRKWEDEKTGLFAVFIVSMYPYVFGLSRVFFLEFALTALVCFSFCCLIYTDNFNHRIYSVLFGISVGIGMLIKQAFIFFLAGPLILTLINILWNHKIASIRRKVILNLGIAFITPLVIAGDWYFHHGLETWHSYCRLDKFFNGPQLFYSISYYFHLLVLDQIGPFFAILSLLGLIYLLKKNQKLQLLDLLLWFIVPYIFLLLLNIRYMYYTVPNLPAVALISSLGISGIKNRYTKRVLLFLVIIWAMVQYFVISYTSPDSTKLRVSFPTTVKIRNCFLGPETWFEFSQPCHILPIADFFYHFPRGGDWNLDGMIWAIERNNRDHRKSIIGVTDGLLHEKKVSWFDPDPRQLEASWRDNFLVVNNYAIEYYVRSKKLPYEVIGLTSSEIDWMNLPLLDFIVSVKEIEVIAPLIAQYYEMIFKAIVPDGSPVFVYKKMRNINDAS
ncbi:MAG: phospholipid carrier-dependent glycosyltransferase [Candidatus Omnitrophica bacterium]|nr:phospholipid carrier-dependent glycosyltransferase [Candidatus Omnitrophota bacterium]